MQNFNDKIQQAQASCKTLFYNTQGSKKAYILGIKHISATEDMGLTLTLPNGDLHVREEFLLVDFETKEIVLIPKGINITPITLKYL